MEENMENKRKYWFFGSKLNTALLLVLIVLMVIALKWMYENKEVYLPTLVQNNELINSQNKPEDQIKAPDLKTNQQKFNLNFLKPILVNFPDSVLAECTYIAKTYFILYKDKVSGGSHMTGSAYEIYSPLGKLLDTCITNPSDGMASSFCTELRTSPKTICKTVFASKDSLGSEEYPNGIDIYNLKN